VTAADDAGFWAVSSTGELRLVLRKGQTFDGTKLTNFDILGAATGTNGTSRSFNRSGQIVWRAKLPEGGSAIYRSDLQ
jgi:hypothetical protein